LSEDESQQDARLAALACFDGAGVGGLVLIDVRIDQHAHRAAADRIAVV
jgi:hypothetical protein